MAENKAPKYGVKNCKITMDGDDIIIRLDSTVILHAAGTKNAKGDDRKVNLVATTGGFTGMGTCKVSLNVTS